MIINFARFHKSEDTTDEKFLLKLVRFLPVVTRVHEHSLASFFLLMYVYTLFESCSHDRIADKIKI